MSNDTDDSDCDLSLWTKISWDWKGRPELADLKRALTPLGVHVYEDPAAKGGDWFGFIFSNTRLTKTELTGISEDES